MNKKLLLPIAKVLMRLNPLDICIVDDVPSYFNEDMLKIAKAAGYSKFQRLYVVDNSMMARLLEHHPDIIILDIKGVTDAALAKDGFGIAELLSRNTNTFIVLTSAHKYKLQNQQFQSDYVIGQRLLTPVDFVAEIDEIVSAALSRKIRFYRAVVFRLGFWVARFALSG
jgi:hypothetical protein